MQAMHASCNLEPRNSMHAVLLLLLMCLQEHPSCVEADIPVCQSSILKLSPLQALKLFVCPEEGTVFPRL